MSCRVARTREWTVRLIHELDDWDASAFVTLTYDDEHLPFCGTLVKSDLQKYFKRVRKEANRKIKYYACGEYGEKYGRPHYHILFYGLGQLLDDRQIIESNWHDGLVHIGAVEHDSIQYVSGYIQKKLTGPMGIENYAATNRTPPFQLQSQGLGLSYVEKFGDDVKRDLEIRMNGKNVGIPRYYRKKLGIDGLSLAPLAQQREQEIIDHYISKGVKYEYEMINEVDKSREQSDLNVKGRLNLKTGTL